MTRPGHARHRQHVGGAADAGPATSVETMSGLPAPGSVWGGLRIEEQLSQAGSGAVFAAWDPELGQRVALKVQASGADPSVTERFLRESAMAGRLGHPRIVSVLRTGTHEGMACVVMRLVDGTDLAGEIARSPLTLERAESVVSQLASALDRAHRSGLVHGRLDPDDVLCTENGDVYLTGFGTTTAPSLDHTAPEQLDGTTRSPAGDVYSLGCVLFECLTGRVPFPSGSPEEVVRLHREAPRPEVTALRPDLPASVDRIVAEAMAIDPGGRYTTARAMADALRTATAAGVGTVSLPVVDPTAVGEAMPTESMPTEALETAAVGAATGSSVFDATSTVPAVSPVAPDGRRRVIDGSLYGVYDEDDTPGRPPRILAAVLVVAVLLVAFLVWRAVNTEAELAVRPESTTTSTPLSEEPPTVEALRLLVPPEIDTCAPPPEQPTDEPVRVVVECPSDGVPASLVFTLYADAEARDQAFDDVVAFVGIPDDGECALGGPAHHDFIGVERVGRVACARSAERVDFVWTTDEAPLLVSAGGPGRFGDHYRAWEALVDRTDAAFPLGVERVLLDQLPDALLEGCRRDIDLLMETGGEAAAICEPEDAPAQWISWAQFPDASSMEAWIAARREDRTDAVFADSDAACTPDGFGQPATEVGIDDEPQEPPAEPTPPAPRPDAGFTEYERGDSTGQILCFIAAEGQPALVWVRDGSRIGSVATGAPGVSMRDLLRWWEVEGYRP